MVGISSACYYPMPTEEALCYIAAVKPKVCEMFFNSPGEIGAEFVRSVKEFSTTYGFKVDSVHPYSSFAETSFFFSDYGRRTSESIDIYRRYFSGAAELGARLFVFHGALLKTNIPAQLYAERFYMLSSAAREEGITLCQENVSRCLAGQVSYVGELKALLGEDISFTLDVKQAHRAGEDVFEMARAMGDRLKLVHVNDFDPFHECLLPGNGAFDLAGFKRLLDGQGYSGNYIIEVYRDNYGEYSAVKDSYDALDKLFYPKDI